MRNDSLWRDDPNHGKPFSRDLVQQAERVTSNLNMLNMPVHFIGTRLADAIRETDADVPDIEDLNWPSQSLLCVLPHDFSGGAYHCPIRERVIKPCIFSLTRFDAFIDVGTGIARTGWILLYIDNEMAMGRQIGHLADALNASDSWDSPWDKPVEIESADRGQLIWMRRFALTYLLALNTAHAPEMRQPTAITEHKRRHQSRWQGHVIDFPRLESIAQGGTHASPRAHFRRGHMRRQPCGSGAVNRRPVWIRPTWVNARDGVAA